MRLKIIIVEPKYQMNAGYIARIAKNFGVKKLFFVNPRANLNGKKAVMFSKHGADLLKSAKVYGTFEQAIRGCDVIVGTTGIWRKKERFEKEYKLKDVISKIRKEYTKDAVVGLVVGRDDTGLNREELEKCDILAHIPSNPLYPSLNISHALAIMLYIMTEGGFKGYEAPKGEEPRLEEFDTLMRVFEEMTSGKRIREKKNVRNIFAKMVRKSQPSRNELHAMITAFK